MPDSDSNYKVIRTDARTIGLGFAGAWLMFLIACSLLTAVLIFSATQFQIRFANLLLDGGSLSIWKAEQLRQQWRESQAASRQTMTTLRNQVNDTREQLGRVISQRNLVRQSIADASNEAARATKEIVESIEKVDTQFSARLKSAPPDQFSAILVEKIGALSLSDKNLSDKVARYNKTQDNLQDLKSRLNTLNEQMRSINDVLTFNREGLKAAEESGRLVLTSKEGEDLKGEQRIQIENAIFEFDAMYTGILGKTAYKLTLFPSDVLVLMLVISMGLLGSSLQLIYIWIMQIEQKNVAFYILRPFFGVITAFVIFIVAKAGIPLIADPSRVGANAPINPYFISFLAIISGLLSERALAALLRLGSSYFRETDTGEPARWARSDLRREFELAHRDPNVLRKMLKAKDSE